jgi:hypothetical protein
MDELRAEQAKGKGGREKTLEKLKQMQDALKRKVRPFLHLTGAPKSRSPPSVFLAD